MRAKVLVLTAVLVLLAASGAAAKQTNPIAARLLSSPAVQPPPGWTLKAKGALTGPMLGAGEVIFASEGVRTKFDAVVDFALANPQYLGSVVFYIAPTAGAARTALATLRRSEASRGVTWTPIGRAVGLPNAADAWGMGAQPIPMAFTTIGPLLVVGNPGPFAPNTTRQRQKAALAAQTLLRYGVAQAQKSGISP